MKMFLSTNKLLLCLLITVVFSGLDLKAQDKGMVFFEGTWQEVLDEASLQDKFIFVDCYTTWCGPCKKMAREVFPDADVGDFFNDRFINFKLDMEKGEGPTMRSEWGVNAYPTMIFFNPSGEETHRIKGYKKPDKFLAEARKGLLDMEQVSELKARYEDGERSPEFLYEYANNLQMSGSSKGEEVFNEYLDTQAPEDLTSPENLELIFNFADNIESRSFDILMKDKGKFIEQYSEAKVNGKIQQSAFKALQKSIQKSDQALLKKINVALKDADPDKGVQKAAQVNIAYYQGVKDWKNYAKAATSYLDKYETNDVSYLNNTAWAFYENVTKKSYLKKAEEWARQSVEINSQFFNNDTYAHLLYKNGKTEEAILIAEKAITIAKYSKKDYTGTQALLDKMLTE